MSIRYKKDLSRLAAIKKLHIPYFEGHYYMVYLWETQEAMLDNATEDAGVNEDTGAFCAHTHYILSLPDNGPAAARAAKKVGEVHFVRGDWNMEYVAHELYHATTHLCRILGLAPMQNIEFEERAAYIHGAMVDVCYRWLWEVDRPKRKGCLQKAWNFIMKFLGKLNNWIFIEGQKWMGTLIKK